MKKLLIAAIASTISVQALAQVQGWGVHPSNKSEAILNHEFGSSPVVQDGEQESWRLISRHWAKDSQALTEPRDHSWNTGLVVNGTGGIGGSRADYQVAYGSDHKGSSTYYEYQEPFVSFSQQRSWASCSVTSHYRDWPAVRGGSQHCVYQIRLPETHKDDAWFPWAISSDSDLTIQGRMRLPTLDTKNEFVIQLAMFYYVRNKITGQYIAMVNLSHDNRGPQYDSPQRDHQVGFVGTSLADTQSKYMSKSDYSAPFRSHTWGRVNAKDNDWFRFHVSREQFNNQIDDLINSGKFGLRKAPSKYTSSIAQLVKAEASSKRATAMVSEFKSASAATRDDLAPENWALVNVGFILEVFPKNRTERPRINTGASFGEMMVLSCTTNPETGKGGC